ncbi:MAG TPA: FTR1 family protein [Candidatus Thermoplasmatota archaeon]|nr:FTR1 family protein [Candidatus Thermoplasmatota archaeon]
MLSPEATLIVLRESLEGFLIISILTGLVMKFGKPQANKFLLAGAISAVAATLLLGVLSDAAAREFLEQSGSEALFAAGAALIAAVILTYMIVWMYKHTIGLVAEMRGKAKATVEVGKPVMLFLLAFAAVGREGIETILFFATLAPTSTAATLALSAFVGFSVSAILAYLVYHGIVRLNVSKFFAVSGILLVLFAAGLLASAVHGFGEVGWLPEMGPAWSTKAVLDEDGSVGGIAHAVLGYRDSPTWLEFGAYALYALGVGAWYLRGIRLHVRGAPQPIES